jgi:enoyl-[acyl-carrier protein] reductase I
VTTAGKGIAGFNAFIDFAEKLSPLGNATGEDCANYCVSLFSDFTRKVTMQNLYHDGGFSSTGFTEDLMRKLEEGNG